MSLSAPSPKRRKTHRSVAGCLTCRRRKVKCDGQFSPCGNCSRLQIPCTPSFHSNFKTWIPASPSNSSFDGSSGRQEQTPTPISNLYDNSWQTEQAFSSVDIIIGNDIVDNSSTIWQEQISENWLQDTSCDVLATLFPNEFTRSQVATQSIAGCSSLEFQKDIPMEDESHRTLTQFSDVELWSCSGVDSTSKSISSLFRSSAGSFSIPDLGRLSFPPDVDFSNLENWRVPYPLYPLNPEVDGDRRLLKHYDTYMSKFLSVKSAPWNFYSYMLLSSQGASNSPLRHSILAWTASHLSWCNSTQSLSGEVHYMKATEAVQELLTDLHGEIGNKLSFSNAMTAEKLSMLLSTSYFLSQSDIMLCNHKALSERLGNIRALLDISWDKFQENLGGLECRILIWLAYLDLRSTLWISPKRKETGQRSGYQKDLLNLLVTRNALLTLRGAKSDHYLKDCFGRDYPKTELQEDLMQEPAKLISDDMMSIFSRLKGFEAWNDEANLEVLESPMMEELRTAKVQALRSDIARIRAECKVIHQDLLAAGTGAEHISRTEFHSLTTIALHLSATILLNRIIAPTVRTDPEAQSAAREIIQITRRLRKAKYLATPKSLIWPLPIFIAGIEIDDGIYQDWILEYMQELNAWGASTNNGRELLVEVMKRQECEGRRVKVGDVIEQFGGSRVMI